MAFLQAFIDDSASEVGDQRLFMAGYLNRAEKWALFSDAWDDELRSAPSIDYLKMAEANGLRDQFAGWEPEERDEKLNGLVRVVRHFKPLSFEVSVPRKQFNSLVKSVAPRGLGNPHFVCAFGIVSILSRFAAGAHADMPIRFIFDRQNEISGDVHTFFHQMISKLPRQAQELISGIPNFEDDKEIKPLQAADMLAWHVRREHEQSPLSRWDTYAGRRL